MTARRESIGTGAALLATKAVAATTVRETAQHKLDVLFPGGTGFIGPHQLNNHSRAAGRRQNRRGRSWRACPARRAAGRRVSVKVTLM